MIENVAIMTIIYTLVIVLLIVLIVLGIKSIFAINTLNDSLKDINKKLHSFDGLFDFVEKLGNTLLIVNKKFISKIDYVVRLFTGSRKDDKNE